MSYKKNPLNSQYYFKNISRRWQLEANKAVETIIVLSPYLTSKTAESVLCKAKLHNCDIEIYTIFSVSNFISNASSLKTVKLLYQNGCKLYHLPKLHAKIIIIPGIFASIGSQNLTKNGKNNKEASIAIFDPIEISKIENELKKWLPQRKIITFQMISDIENRIKDLRRKLNNVNREIRKEINDLENEVWEKEFQREQARLAKASEELRRKQEAERLAKAAEELRRKQEAERLAKAAEELKRKQEAERLAKAAKEAKERRIKAANLRTALNISQNKTQQLSTLHGRVEKEIAEEFIRYCAYWDHPTGDFVDSPGHAKRIYGSEYDWRINFGANTFLLGRSIYQCQQTILHFLNNLQFGTSTSHLKLREDLKLKVRESVINSQGDQYQLYPLEYNNFMRFGTQLISVDDFVNLIIKKADLINLFQVVDQI